MWRRTNRLPPSHWAAAFTLVELLVVIAIIGVLIALLLPAVQAARESARRVHCQNNVKQQLVALHLVHDADRAFPGGHEVYIPGDPMKHTNHSWVVRTLPHIEQQSVYARYNLSVPWDKPPNAAITRIQATAIDLPMLLCPSITEVRDKAVTDYAAINGTDGVSYNTSPGRGPVLIVSSWANGGDYAAGIFPAVGPVVKNSRVRIKDIADGTGNTIAVGEDAGRTDADRLWADAEHTFAHHGLINDRENRNNELFSEHPGGVHVGMGDTSVRFLSESTAEIVIDFLTTRAGEEQVHSSY